VPAFFSGNRKEQRKRTVSWQTANFSPLDLEHSSAYLIKAVFIGDKEFALRFKDSVPFYNTYTRTLVFPYPAPLRLQAPQQRYRATATLIKQMWWPLTEIFWVSAALRWSKQKDGQVPSTWNTKPHQDERMERTKKDIFRSATRN